ncbi:MAG: intermembrane transport protein PqiB [Lysobacterales bacterium]
MDETIERPKVTTPGARLSVIWLIPLLAIVLSLAVAWQTYQERGPLVEIQFSSGSGLQAEKTQIKHLGVVVGVVEKVELSEDLASVVVYARMDRSVDRFLGETTRFWVVRARFDGGAVSGLGTILSGAYIEVEWTAEPQQRKLAFVGLSDPPQTDPGTPGLHVRLTTDYAGSIHIGAPIYYRQLRVGQVERRDLSEDGRFITFEGFVEAPFDQFINRNTRFWNVSGLDVIADADGFNVHFESFDALLSGGIAFESIGGDLAQPIETDGETFPIYRHRRDANESLFYDPAHAEDHRFIAELTESVNGLRPGAPVMFDGIKLGNVLDVVYEPTTGPDSPDRIYAIFQLQPSRVGFEGLSLDELRDGLNYWVQSGIRAQLASANLLTGAKRLDLVMKPELENASINMDARPYPQFPSIPSSSQALTNNVQTLVRNLSELPLDELIQAGTQLLGDIGSMVASDEAQSIPAELSLVLNAVASAAGNLNAASSDLPALVKSLNALSGQADETLGGLSPSSPFYVELESTLRELSAAAGKVSELAQKLEENL